MSTTTDPEARPLPDLGPSAVVAAEPTFARVVGFAGLFALVLGVVAVVATRVSGTPRIISEGMGYLLGAGGLALMLFHAVRDGETEIRRLYGGFGLFLLVFALVVSLVPGPLLGAPVEGADKAVGFYLIPWGLGAGLLSLMFLVPYGRHETDPVFRAVAEYLLLGVGAALLLGGVVFGALKPDFLTGPGVALALLGLGFVCGYLGLTDSSDGLGYKVAFALGLVGGALVLGALARAAVPTLLFDGPNALRKPNGSLDGWAVTGRLLIAAAVAGLLVPAYRATRASLKDALETPPGTHIAVVIVNWALVAVAVLGLLAPVLVTLGAMAVGAMKAGVVTTTPTPFLVPSGVLLAGLGLVFLGVGVGVCSDSPFATLTRRELASFFLSPVGYLVIGGMAAAQWTGYMDFVSTLTDARGGSIPEPIVRYYFFALLPVIALLLEVPALTMRAVAEERRTGSLEVLLTAPVGEASVILSKFLATWVFFLLTWTPSGLYLIALRVEGGSAFDYRPLLSFYAALAAQGAAFVAIGVMFSTFTKNQIIAAVLTFVVMLGFVFAYLIRESTGGMGLGGTLQGAIGRLSFLHIWRETLAGQLPVRDVVLYLSLAVFSLFVSVRVLEARKWA